MGGGQWQQTQHLNHSRHAPAANHQRLTALSFPAPFYAAGPPRSQQSQQQPQQPPQPPMQAGVAQQLQLDAEMAPAVPPFLTLSPELLAAVASFLEGGYVLRTLPLVAAPLADNVDALTSQGVHSLVLHARNLPILERCAPRLRSLNCLVIQGCRPLRCLGLDTPATPRDDQLLARLERVLSAHPRPPFVHSLRRLACDDISLEDEAATARLGRVLARLPRLAALALPHAQINDKGMAQMLDALLASAPLGEEQATSEMMDTDTSGYSVSCLTSLRTLDLEDNMLEDPGVLESVLACFPSLKRLSLKDNFIPQLATEEIMRRVAPHLLLAPPTTTSGSHPLTTAGNHRRHPLLALPSSSTATAALAAAASTPQGSWSCAASPASSPSRSSPPGIDDEEAEIASPIPRKRRAPAAATTTSKPTPMATSPCYTPSPATAYVGRRDPAASSGPTTPTRPRSSAASSAFAAAAASFSGPVPPLGPASTHPRRPISYAERLLLSDPSLASSSRHKTPYAGGAGIGSGMGAPPARLSPLERAMREEEDGDGEGEGEAMEGVKGLLGLGLAGVMLDEEAYGGANALPLYPLTNANPPPKRVRRDVGHETAEAAGASAGADGVGGTQQLSFAEEGH